MQTSTSHRKHQSPARRAVLAVSGSIAAMLAVVSLAVGGFVWWAVDGDGYASSSTHELATDRAALTSANLDIDLDGVGWLVDVDDRPEVRVHVDPASDEPVFVGIARTADVQRYLDGVGHTTVHDLEALPFDADLRDHGGRDRAAAPADQDIWAASETGTGEQTLAWDVADGDWSVVAMNADGSPGLRTDVSAAAKIPYALPLGIATGGAGVLLLLVAGALFVAASRPVRRPQAQAARASVSGAAS